MIKHKKESLVFITNIPSPYNLDLFNSLSLHFDLKVYYFDHIEWDRLWNLNLLSEFYYSKVFKKDIFYHFFHKLNRQLYFNLECFKLCFESDSDNFILSGTYFSPNVLISIIILKLRKKKIYWFGEKIGPTKNILHKILKYILFSPIRLFANKIFAVGQVATNSYRDFGFKKDIVNTPYSINNLKFNVEKRLCNSGKIIILTSGSLIHRKGIDIIIRALNQLEKSIFKKFEFWILGEGPEKQNLIDLANTSVNIRFIGFVEPDNISTYFKNADIFIFCSRYDGWGVVINEAMASGLPIIVSKNCGASEYIDKEGGFIVDDSINNLSNIITYLIQNEGVRKNMGYYNSQKSKTISSEIIAHKFFNSIVK